LAIKDEGWDKLIEMQEKAVTNSQALVAANQLAE
jgi:hypothetical protein